VVFPSSMPPEAEPLELAQRAIGLWNELAAAYDAIEARLGAGAWTGFEEIATHIADLERELQPMVTMIAAMRAATPAPATQLATLWHQLDVLVEALVRRQRQLERAATAARDMVAARLVRTRIARSRAGDYAPTGLPSPRFTSRRV